MLDVYLMDAEEFLRRKTEPFIDLTITSPPYYNAREYSQYESVSAYIDKLRRIFREVYRLTRPFRMCVINISPVLVPKTKSTGLSRRIPLPYYVVPMMEEVGWEFLEDIIWVKPEGAAPNRNGNFYQRREPLMYKPNIITEYVLVFRKKVEGQRFRDVFERRSYVEGKYERTNVWHLNAQSHPRHPAVFPLALPQRLITYYSYEGDIVFDPFLGSGTTLVAAGQLGRNGVGTEIHEEYRQLAQERIANEVGMFG